MSKHLRMLASAVTVALFVTGLLAISAGAATPAGGAIRIFGTSNGLGGGGKVLVTGAIGDHGTSQSATKTGKPNANGSYVLLKLTQGTILLNKTALDQKHQSRVQHAAARSGYLLAIRRSVCGALPFVNGTGPLYRVSRALPTSPCRVGFTLPRYSSGAKAGQVQLE